MHPMKTALANLWRLERALLPARRVSAFRKLLLIGRGIEGVEGAQLAGFDMFARSLYHAGIAFRRIDLPSLFTVERAVQTASEDAVLLMIGWAEPKEEVLAMMERLYLHPGRPRIIFLDYYAQSSTPFFDVLPFVDCYAKRQVLRDRSTYLRDDLAGGFVFTDFFAKSHPFDLGGWHFGSSLEEGHAHKLVHAWNLGVYPRYRRMVEWSPSLPWSLRPIDVHARLAIGSHSRDKWEWYQEYRTVARREVEKLAPRFNLTGQDQVRRSRYFYELARSKIAFSPFGWGEVCIRDFEAAASGTLLVKPSMNHLETSPDIYRPYETYVPVEWDLSDLVEKCTYYLEHPNEGRRIAEAARLVLRDYFEGDGFVRDLERVLETAGVDSGGRIASSHS